jgi:hypothetical protein
MKIIKSLNSVTVSRPQKLPNQNVINITDAVYIERQDITEKQRQYKSEIDYRPKSRLHQPPAPSADSAYKDSVA